MRVGTSIRSAYVVDDSRDAARWMVERAQAAAAAGLDSMFVGDHHATGVAYLQNSAILGRMLAEWDERRAGALYLLPLWNPVLVAEQVGTLAAIAAGPFVVQCALGGGEAQFAAMGADIRRRVSAFESALATVRALLAGDDVDGVRAGPRPPAPVEVHIGAEAPPAIERAARLGDAWICGPGVPSARAIEDLDRYREACARHGSTPHAIVRRDVHVGHDDADAVVVAGPVLEAGYRGFAEGVAVVGGPEAVAERIAPLAEAGFEEVLVRHLAEDQTQVLASFERLADVRRRLLPVGA